MLRNPIRNATIEFNDNRISKYSSQKGKCAVTGEFMTHVDMDCHHKRPRFLGGSDKYDNLFCVKRDVHRLIHATNTKTIDYYLGLIRPNKDSLTKINKFRTAVGNEVIKLTI